MRVGIVLMWMIAMFTSASSSATDEAYDPLRVSSDELPKPLELKVKDSQRSREIPVRVYMPKESTSPAPVVLFSHGLGGTRGGSAFLGKHWAARGFVAVFVQHPGSDDSIWKYKPVAERLTAMQKAAGLDNFMLRVKDIPAVLDQLERWNKEIGHPLSGKLDMAKVGMSGHSFGAVTTQAVSGQIFPISGTNLTDKRIKAAIAFSPSTPRYGGDAKEAFGTVKIPWMLMTGTKDTAPIGAVDVKSRRAVFPALPPGGKYELVLNNAEHSVFTDRALPGDKEKRNPNHHRIIIALSTAFWDSYLREGAAAKKWLDGEGPRQILEPADEWQKK